MKVQGSWLYENLGPCTLSHEPMLNNTIGYRPTWAEINLDNLNYNFAQIKKLIGPHIKVMGTVKADAYGHGLVPIAKKLSECGVDYLGVASIDEGIQLREAKIYMPILIMGLILKDDIDPLLKYDLATTVCTEELAEALNKRARVLHNRLTVHIKVDTGMGRIGVMHKEAFEVVNNIRKNKLLNVEGIFTHFAFADMNKKFTLYQIDLFNRLIETLQKSMIRIPLIHAANSFGIINFKESHFNMVRPGLAMYGLCQDDRIRMRFKPVLSLKTKVVYVKNVPKGYGISYGHTYITQRKTTIVTLPVGYGDGYPRNLSNIASVLIKGKRFKISGRICMDQIMVDVADTPVNIGDEVVLIGSQGKNTITVEELASLYGTIPYEIVCGLGSRIPRVYTDAS